MTPLDDATLRQVQAANPGASTWLSANAGSGKTRVLTDRVARLLLDDVKPQNILCLTYTKAAASEMQNRLFQKLGEWSMMPDGDLAKTLSELGVTLATRELARARRLFAAAIETPGGLRIQTIHSFCASLLHRFPLEAGISPRFTEMDDRAAALLRDEIVELLADGEGRAALDGIAAFLTDIDLSRLTAAIAARRQDLPHSKDQQQVWRGLGLSPDQNRESLVQATFTKSDTEILVTLINVLNGAIGTNDGKAAAKLVKLDPKNLDFDSIPVLADLLLTGSGAKTPCAAKVGKFPTKDSRAAMGSVAEALDDLMERIEVASETANRLITAERTLALYRFAEVFLKAYARRKQERGWLDFDDLIQKAIALLSDPAVASWVLYRLDGGLDHILVDEAQDTSPAQWQVIQRLAQEFTAGLGARDDVARSIFVVGDKKQSIYSFQGADPREFDRMRDYFAGKLDDIGAELQPMELEYSFRSSEAILRLVDRVIEGAGTPHLPSDVRHRAFKSRMPGRVDLWAPVPKTGPRKKQNWYDPVDIVSDDHHDVVLAREIAARIEQMIGQETIPAKDGERRHVTAGDILILVRRRSRLFEEIIRACKALDLPVAGADRLKLGGELAVRDLSALLAFLATPEDDLALACALRSPLFGWSEAQLYDIAAGRGKTYLWRALQNRTDDHPETLALLQDLRDHADFLRPYDLIERILIRHDGRRRLIARLGPEAEDGIDALLTQALAFERAEVPSLTGFLVWMETDNVEVKRQMDSAGDLIRVMTVHGAKGLEAPIVILPDTAQRRSEVKDQIVPLDSGQMVWKPAASLQPQAVRSAVDRLKDASREEELRLFYVAMTRAETWLIVAAAGDLGNSGTCWYDLARRAMQALGAVPLDTPTGPGLRYAFEDWSAGAMQKPETDRTREAALPDWAGIAPKPPDHPAETGAPSDLGGAKAILLDAEETDSEAAKREGRLSHRLLEHLPATSPDAWTKLAPALLAGGADHAAPAEALDILDRVRPVLLSDTLQYLFSDATLAEIGISAELSELGGRRVSGTIDRLVLTPERVLAVDFKTNAVIPETPAQVPEGILRQMGAYLSALRQIYPERQVETAILWTRRPVLMPMPDNIVMQALRRTATS